MFTPGLNLFSMSLDSQTNRLFQVLDEADMLNEDGKIIKNTSRTATPEERSAGNILRFLSNRWELETRVMPYVHSDIYEDMKNTYDDVTSIDDWMLAETLNINLYAFPPEMNNQVFPDIQYNSWDKWQKMITIPQGTTRFMQVDYYFHDGLSSFRWPNESAYRSENNSLIITDEDISYTIQSTAFLEAFKDAQEAWTEDSWAWTEWVISYTTSSGILIIMLDNFYARYDESTGKYILQNWSGKVFFE